MLSPHYAEIKRQRDHGRVDVAVSMLNTHRPASDDDAFEAVVSLFLAGDLSNAVGICNNHSWQQPWAANIAKAMSEMLVNNNAPRALVLARVAILDQTIARDALAFYLSLLQANGLTEEAYEYVCTRLEPPPFGDTFLLAVMAEIAAAAKQWLHAYQLACAVMAMDSMNYRALIVLSNANFHANNFHEALGNAQCAELANPGSPAAALQLMRCHNKLGDFYSAVAAFDGVDAQSGIASEMYIELGIAHAGLENAGRAAEAYRAALNDDPPPAQAIRALLKIHMDSADHAALDAFARQFATAIANDAECLSLQAMHELQQGHVAAAADYFRRCGELNIAREDAYTQLPWPVPEPRLRHDYEQLELLQRRGKLNTAGEEALRTLQPYYAQSGNTARAYAPEGAAGTALKKALCEVHHYPDPPFDGEAVAARDYAAIEARYETEKLVVIDDFLTPLGLHALRSYSEEATVWKLYNPGGYTAGLLGKGFAPRVLLTIADELRRKMPNVIRDFPLLQAWGFKYDQRLQGINMHADFARVNINFWITPQAACADDTTGGMVVYNHPVPKSWSFEDYNINPPKLKAYLKVHDAQPLRVPYRENRCVLFDSSLIHVTDELHFKPGFENRRVNITLLFGRARATE